MVQMILILLPVYSACLNHKVTLSIICDMQISLDLKAGTFLYSESNLLCVWWLCVEFCCLLNDLSSCPNVPAVACSMTNYLYLLRFIMSNIMFRGVPAMLATSRSGLLDIDDIYQIIRTNIAWSYIEICYKYKIYMLKNMKYIWKTSCTYITQIHRHTSHSLREQQADSQMPTIFYLFIYAM